MPFVSTLDAGRHGGPTSLPGAARDLCNTFPGNSPPFQGLSFLACRIKELCGHQFARLVIPPFGKSRQASSRARSSFRFNASLGSSMALCRTSQTAHGKIAGFAACDPLRRHGTRAVAGDPRHGPYAIDWNEPSIRKSARHRDAGLQLPRQPRLPRRRKAMLPRPRRR